LELKGRGKETPLLILIENLASRFEPNKYREEYQEGMRAMIAAQTRTANKSRALCTEARPQLGLDGCPAEEPRAASGRASEKASVRAIAVMKNTKKDRKRSPVAGNALHRTLHTSRTFAAS